ncbi:HAD hydrolase-like protein [Alphaproteobacteria bacterium]|nr:HAD hydrolase-like protein [Alphaproteobacteria bacterium]
MRSILFGSIGVLVECSEIQRKAFNTAFQEYGLDWHWNIANYIKMLEEPGGLNRIVEYSNFKLSQEDAKKIHLLKIKHFKLLSKNSLKPRAGIEDVVQYALKNNIKIGFITTTTKETLDLIIENISNYIDFTKFDLITHDELVNKRKPDSEIYNYALRELKGNNLESIAIENTYESCKSAEDVSIKTLFYPGEYTIYDQKTIVSRNIFKSVKSFFEKG